MASDYSCSYPKNNKYAFLGLCGWFRFLTISRFNFQLKEYDILGFCCGLYEPLRSDDGYVGELIKKILLLDVRRNREIKPIRLIFYAFVSQKILSIFI